MHTDHLRAHIELDSHNWWFTARRRIVLSLLDEWLASRSAEHGSEGAGDLDLVDVGCGAGATLSALRPYGTVIGIEPDLEAAAVARSRTGLEVREGRLPDSIPCADQSFDVVTLLDVLEHVADDERALATIARILERDGCLIVTVPANPHLWSRHDIANEHHRRYTKAELASKLARAGFAVKRISYYNTLLYLPIAAFRLLSRLNPGATHADTGRVPGPVNSALESVFGAERHLLKHMSLPFGVSLIALAQLVGRQSGDTIADGISGGTDAS